MSKPIVATLFTPSLSKRIMSEAAWEKLASFAEIRRNTEDRALEEAEARALLAGAEGCITSWGVRPVTAEVIADAPNLKIVAHAAGTVKPIATDAIWDRGIRVTSASAGIAVDVAETTLGLMIVSIKRIWQLAKHTRAGNWGGPERDKSREMHGKTIGIVGASHVGKRVMEHLKRFDVKVLLYDPYASEELAASYNAKKVSLEELLRQSDIISIHAPNTDETAHMFNRDTMALMKEDVILINTARGRLIDEPALVELLQARPEMLACIDVTDPEPPAVDHPFRKLENVILLPHIAGTITDCTRLGDLAVEEVRRCFAGEPALYEITRDMLPRIG